MSEVWKPYFYLGPLLFSIFNIIALSIRCCYDFCFSHQMGLWNLMRRRIVYLLLFLPVLIVYFPFWNSKLPSVFSFLFRKISFSHSLKVGLLVINSLSFSSSEHVFLSSLFLKDHFVRYKICSWKYFSFRIWKMSCHFSVTCGFKWRICCHPN